MNKQLKDDESQEAVPTNENLTGRSDGPQSQESSAARPEVQINDLNAAVLYANFCRVTGTPEELILDFGLNAQPMGGATNIEIKQRLIVNYFTAKRLLQALGMSIQRHENAFGVLETDVQKRVMPSLRRANAPA